MCTLDVLHLSPFELFSIAGSRGLEKLGIRFIVGEGVQMRNIKGKKKTRLSQNFGNLYVF